MSRNEGILSTKKKINELKLILNKKILHICYTSKQSLYDSLFINLLFIISIV